MILKWFFTILAFMWLYKALKPYFQIQAPPPPPPRRPAPPNDEWVDRKQFEDKDGDYIDYEEVK